MAFVSFTTPETDAKSPIDDAYSTKMKDNFDDLDSRVVTAGAKPFLLELQGKLKYLSTQKRSICAGILNEAVQPSQSRFMLKKSGQTGSLAFDIRRHTSPRTPITGIDHQFSAATSSIAQQGSALSTQSIARATAQISTQSIAHVKAASNVQSIMLMARIEIGGVETANLVQYNLSATIDADTVEGDSIVFAGCTTGANNGTFVIVEKNRGGGNNVVIVNVSGAAQTSAAGTAQLKIMSYNFTNPVDAFFEAGYSHLFASHATGANNGTFLVYKRNESGNNLWVKNPAGVVQAGVAGSADTNLWVFALTAPASTTDYMVGEAAKTASHSSGGNNAGALEIRAVNSGGNNLVLYNTAGVVQGGAAGNINTNRWRYSLPSDPSAQVTAGDTMSFVSHSTGANNGVFTIKEVTTSTVVIYNTAGVVQGGAAGTSITTRKLVKFASDQSSVYTTDSYIEMESMVYSSGYAYSYYDASGIQNAPFKVLQVNRGGGANYNVVIDGTTRGDQLSPGGYVMTEMKSIFTAAPSLASDLTGLEPNLNIHGSSTSFVTAIIPAQTPLMLYITELPTGDPQDLTVTIL